MLRPRTPHGRVRYVFGYLTGEGFFDGLVVDDAGSGSANESVVGNEPGCLSRRL